MKAKKQHWSGDRRSWGRAGILALRILVAVGLVVLIFQWIDLSVLGETIARANFSLVVLILIVAFADRFLMAFKWNILLKGAGIQMSSLEAFKLYLASGFAGTFLPSGVGGDAFRAVRTTMGGRAAGRVTASIIVERVIGLLVVTATAIASLGILVHSGESQLRALYHFAWAVLSLFGLAAFVAVHPRAFKMTKRLLTRFEEYRPIRLLLDVHDAYSAYALHKTTLLVFLVLTFLELGIAITLQYGGALAIGLEVPFGYFVALIPLSFLVTRLPISIGSLGVQEGAYMFLFTRVGLGATEALSLSLIMRAIEWLILIPTGAVFLSDIVTIRRQKTVSAAE